MAASSKSIPQNHHYNDDGEANGAAATAASRRLILGGHPIEKYRYPYFVSIDKNFNGVVLNGALIAPDIVLTAGHIALNHMDNLTLTVGAWSTLANQTTKHEEVIPVDHWIVHPQWTQTYSPHFSNADNVFHHDVMLLKLNRSSTVVRHPVRINRDSNVPRPDQELIMMGLGWTTESYVSPPTIVLETDIRPVTNSYCESRSDPNRPILSYEGLIDDTMICTVSPPNSTMAHDGCAWDSGAPVIIPGTSAHGDVLVALGSTGVACGDPVFPSIQARVSADSDWIDAMVCELSSDPPADFQCSKVHSFNFTNGGTQNTTQEVVIQDPSPTVREGAISVSTATPRVGSGKGSFPVVGVSVMGLAAVLAVVLGAFFRHRNKRRNQYEIV